MNNKKYQTGGTIWLTGLCGAGKTTIANLVAERLSAEEFSVYCLDGDKLRDGLNSDLGFSRADRQENTRRITELAKLFADVGFIAIVSCVSPYRCDRLYARQCHQQANLIFYEVFVDTPLNICEQRDPKGLYRQARQGLIKDFTGIDAPYEVPQAAELGVETSNCTAEESAAQVYEQFKSHYQGQAK